MESAEALPAIALEPAGPCTHACRDRGIASLRDLACALRDLPYGRPPDRADWASLLDAGRGTCSTKHAFLAAVAAEIGAPLDLTLGLYPMSEANTPGVGAILDEAGLAAVPEAHCYVRYRGARVDVTRAGAAAGEEIVFLREETIRPHQIGDYKVAWHRAHLRAWCEEHGLDDWQRVWQVRERCIRALADPG